MSKMNPNEKKENASKNENVNNDKPLGDAYHAGAY